MNTIPSESVVSDKGDSDQGRKIERLEKEIFRLRSAIEELTVLNDLAIAASTSLETDGMLDAIVEKSIKAVRAEQGSILLVTEQKDAPLKTLIRQADRTSRAVTYKVGSTFTGWVLKHQEPLLISDLTTETRIQVTEQERKDIRSVLCVPIRFRGQMLGILTVTNKKTSDSFQSSDLRLLSIIASQSGQLIRNSQLQTETLEKKRMESELALARRIQMDLLPQKHPNVEGLDIFGYFRPADQVSGDYYDYFDLGEERFGIVIADVSGHGPSSALVMTMVKGILHAITQRFQSPSALITEMNRTLNDIIPGDMFVTMMFLLFDMKNRTLRLSNAGHNPMLFCDNRSGSVSMVECQGPILGFSKALPFSETEITVNPGDLSLVYTDGVTEAMNSDGEMFEESRLIEAVQQNTSHKAVEIVRHIQEKLRHFKGQTPQNDDMAIIAIKAV